MTVNLKEFTVGVNVSGMEIASYPEFADNSYFSYYASKGITVVRLPGLWENWQPTAGGDLDETYVNNVRTVIKLAAYNGISVILEPFHNYGRRVMGSATQVFGDGVLTTALFEDAWTKVLSAVNDLSNIVALDIMNEPHDFSGADMAAQSGVWNTYAQAAVTSIRQINTAVPILIEGYQYASASGWTTYNPNILTAITDPNDNIIYSAHAYGDRDASGTHYFWDSEVAAGDLITGGALTVDTLANRMKIFSEWCSTNNVSGLIGETGVGYQDSNSSNYDTGWNTELDNALSAMQSANIPVMYWAGGPDFHNEYTDSSGTVFPYYPYLIDKMNGEDSRQMAVLCKYLGSSDAPSTYTLISESTKPVNGVFVLQLDIRGYIPTSFSVNLSDGTAEGAFSVSLPLSITSGSNFYDEITYTPNQDVTAVSISSTNTGGLTNPSSLNLNTGSKMELLGNAPVQSPSFVGDVAGNGNLVLGNQDVATDVSILLHSNGTAAYSDATIKVTGGSTTAANGGTVQFMSAQIVFTGATADFSAATVAVKVPTVADATDSSTNAASTEFVQKSQGRLINYKVADLPAASTDPSYGSSVYASDGCKPGEPTGEGTGVPVFWDGTNWINYGSMTAVTA